MLESENSPQISRSLKYSLIDGFFWSVMVGCGESFFAAFGVFLNAGNFIIGLLGSLPMTLGSIAQLGTKKLLTFTSSRKNIVCLGVVLQALMYIPITAIFFAQQYAPPIFLFLVCLYHILGMIFTPAWNSWMGDLVDTKIRGAYFGKRNLINGFASFIAMLIAGFILQRYTSHNAQYTGFVVIFTVALLSRLASFVALSKKFEPDWDFRDESTQSFLDFLKKARSTNFGLLSSYLSVMSFAVYLSVPYFAPFMLREIKLTYATYTLVLAAAVIAKCFSMPIWGKIVDRYGGRKVLSICAWGLPMSTLLWVFSHNIWYLIAIQLYSGWCWAGYEIAAFSLMYDNTSRQNRATLISYYNVMNGIAIIMGSLIGGIIVHYSHFLNSKYLLIFAISGLARAFVSLRLLKSIQEIRSVEKISSRGLILRMISASTNGANYGPLTFWRKKKY